MTGFSRQFVQAVSDWQKGGVATKKGPRIKEVMPPLAEKFLSCNLPCYRQEAHDKGRTWQLIADNQLPERIAAWTTDFMVARTFKGGVPPSGLQGVIFKIIPPHGSVVLNLSELYRDPDFFAAIKQFSGDIKI